MPQVGFKKKNLKKGKKDKKIRKPKLVLDEPTSFEEHKQDHGSRNVSSALLREQEEAKKTKRNER